MSIPAEPSLFQYEVQVFISFFISANSVLIFGNSGAFAKRIHYTIHANVAAKCQLCHPRTAAVNNSIIPC